MFNFGRTNEHTSPSRCIFNQGLPDCHGNQRFPCVAWVYFGQHCCEPTHHLHHRYQGNAINSHWAQTLRPPSHLCPDVTHQAEYMLSKNQQIDKKACNNFTLNLIIITNTGINDSLLEYQKTRPNVLTFIS